MLVDIDDCPRFFCIHCAKWSVDADRKCGQCPKLDHKKVKFYKPYFKCYDCGMHHLICSQFTPRNPEYADFQNWTGFDDYWKVYEQAWLTDASRNRGVAFVLDDNYDIMYYVPLETWLYGEIIQNGVLMATTKAYHKRTVKDGWTHYPMVYEAINGVLLNSQPNPEREQRIRHGRRRAESPAN